MPSTTSPQNRRVGKAHHPSPQNHVQYGTTTITYTVEFRHRKTLGIEVHPDGQVLALAPEGTDIAVVQAKLVKRGAWILRQQRLFAQYPPVQPERRFVSGETHRYLGRQYRLQVVCDNIERVTITRGQIWVVVKNSERVPKLLEQWLRARAELVLSERMTICLEQVVGFGIVHSGQFKLKRMRQRWGSCTPEGIIYLNPLLIAAPKECIDYVLIHELVHTVYPHHKRAFYTLLSRCLPNWKELRLRLNRVVELP